MIKLKNKPKKSSISRAGTFLGLAGVIVFLGIQSAEANYLGSYSTKSDYISELGVNQNSALIFNISMMVAGVLIMLCSRKLQRGKFLKRFTIPLMIYGLGTFGVGLFNSDNIGALHVISAGLLFFTGPVAAWYSRKHAIGSVRRIAAFLATISILFLIAFFLRTDDFNVGGLERFTVYPITMWMIVYGFYLNGSKNPIEK